VAAVVGVLLLVVVILFAGAAWGTAIVDGGERRVVVGRVEVPRLAGSPVADAQRQLEALELLVALEYQPNEVVPAGVVFEQQPIAGAKVEVGSEITLLVSDGPSGVPVPDLRGFQGTEAAALLQALGVPNEVQSVPDESVRPGEVVGTVPAAGVRTRADTPVVVQVSSGPAPRTVPAVVDVTVAEAIAAIARAGLGLGQVTRQYVEGRDAGAVISTDPAPGTAAPRDYPVNLTVTGPPPPVRVPGLVGLTRANATSVAGSVSGLDVRVRIQTLTPGDDRNGRVVRQSLPPDAEVPPGTILEVVVGQVPTPTTTTTVPAAGSGTGASTTTTTTRPGGR
jgi:serine/threonine-protein kinase